MILITKMRHIRGTHPWSYFTAFGFGFTNVQSDSKVSTYFFNYSCDDNKFLYF